MARTSAETKSRTYRETHPWLTFTLALNKANHRLWLLLGEAVSKTDHLLMALVRPETAGDLLQVYLAKGAAATTAIEGNTLSEDEVAALIENKLRLPPSKAYLGHEVENILEAFAQIQREVLAADVDKELDTDISVARICEYNRLVLRGLELDKDVVPGTIRDYSVVVNGYRGAPARDCTYLLERLCSWLKAPEFNPDDDDHQWHWAQALVKACIAHLYLAWIHPFGDGNGRTARLVEFQILLAEGFPAPACQLLSNHYHLTRTRYYQQLHDASAHSDPLPFLQYAIEGYVDGLREQINRVWAMQYVDRWEQYIYERFGEASSEAQRRRLRLIKDISASSIRPVIGEALPALRPIPRVELRRLTPEIVEFYVGKTDKTLSRDLTTLRKMELLLHDESGFVPNSDIILGFMPVAARARHAHPLF